MAIEAGVLVKHCTRHTNVFHCVFLCFVIEQPKKKKTTAKAVRNYEKQYLQSRCERSWCTDELKNTERLSYIPKAAAVTGAEIK